MTLAKLCSANPMETIAPKLYMNQGKRQISVRKSIKNRSKILTGEIEFYRIKNIKFKRFTNYLLPKGGRAPRIKTMARPDLQAANFREFLSLLYQPFAV